MRKIIIAIAFLVAWSNADAKLWLNELMQSNIDAIYSGGDFPDSWVEIYNDGDASLRLINYRIGDTDNFDDAFVLNSSVGIGAKGHILIFCDKVGSGHHTDFRIDSGKGKLYLFNPQGEVIDYVSYPKMLAPNVAYGRSEDAGDKWGFELVATPREANGGGHCSALLPEPVFSEKGAARYNVRKLQEVVVSIPEGVSLPADTRLYVTTDGSEPTVESPCYDRAFTISSSQSMVIRAKLISAEAISPRATTHTYISHPRNVELPIIALTTNQEYLDDEDMGIWINFNNDWRRPVNVEFFTTSGEAAHFNQLGEFRIHGGWSRNHAQKSLAVYSNKRFGTKKFSYPFFIDRPDVEKSKSFVLRNGGNNFADARINDSFVHTLFGRNCNVDYQAYAPAICYINGKYRGFYALRQRSNEDYVEDCYDGLEDIDMLENWNDVKAGSDASFLQLRDLYRSNPTYAQMAKAIDVENFANLFIANTWAANTDFPGNNIVMWRPTATGGKWRWIMKDLDFITTNPPTFNYLDFLLLTGDYTYNQNYANTHDATKLFRVMAAMKEFREPLIDRFFVYLGDFLRPASTAAIIDEQRDAIAPEYTAHLACYNNPTSYNGWLSRVNDLKKWCAARSAAMPDILCNYFHLGAPVDMNIKGGDNAFVVNGVPVKGDTFEGKWPSGREVTVGSDNPGNGWKVTLTMKDGTQLSYNVENPQVAITPGENIASVALEAVGSSSVNGVTADVPEQVTVNLCGDLLVVEADAPIATIVVTDLAGRVIATANPGVHSTQLRLSAQSGVCIASVTLATGFRTAKKILL